MSFEEFHSALRVLATLNMQDLVDADVIDQSDNAGWDAFTADPLLWILRADERSAAAVWLAMERRANLWQLPPFTIERQPTPTYGNIVPFSPRKARVR